MRCQISKRSTFKSDLQQFKDQLFSEHMKITENAVPPKFPFIHVQSNFLDC